MKRNIIIQEDIMDRVLILQKVVDKKMTQVEAGEEMKISERQVRRLIKRFKREGWEGLVVKKQKGNKRFSPEFKETVLRFIRHQYYDFGPTFAAEKLKENQGMEVSKETLRQWMMTEALWKGKRRKKARIHQSRERRARFGELVQIDGSPHDWFEGRASKCCLIVMIDDATSKIIYMRFEESETTFGYMRCIEKHIKRYGRPLAYYSDRHSIFKTTREQCVDRLLKDTQLHRSLKELGIELICANSPQAKGRVERANSTLQDRLIKEMRLRGISTMDEGNDYLEEYMKQHNTKFSVEARNLEDAHRALSRTDKELELILSKRESRKVSKNLEFSLGKKVYQLQGIGNGYRLRQSHVTICETAQGVTKVMYDGKALQYTVFESKTGPREADCKDLNRIVDNLLTETIVGYPQGPQASAQLSY